MSNIYDSGAPNMMSIGRVSQRLVIAGVGRFDPSPGGKWTYTPDPDLTPDEAASNLFAAVDRLMGRPAFGLEAMSSDAWTFTALPDGRIAFQGMVAERPRLFIGTMEEISEMIKVAQPKEPQ